MPNGDSYEKYLEELQKLLGENYEQAKAYTNLIMIAGYAGYFTIVNYCKDYLSNSFFVWSLFLMSISLIAFVSHEIYGMIINTIHLRKFHDALSDKDHYAENLQIYNKEIQKQKNKIGRIWSYHLYITLFCAILAVILFLIPLGVEAIRMIFYRMEL